MITKLDQMIDAAKAKPRKKLVVADAEDSHTMQAVNAAVDMGFVNAFLIGRQTEIAKVCIKEGIDVDKFSIIEANSDVECVKVAVKMVHDGEADILMKGLVSTDKYMRGILNKEYGLLPPKAILSHVAILEIPMYHKLLLVSDIAVIPYPDLSQKVAMAKYLIKTAQILGIQTPKVAVMAPSEQLLPGMQSSVEAAILAKMGDRGQLGSAIVDGPLAVDVAMIKEVADTKHLVSPVAGDADCMLFPNLDASNAFFKASTKVCHANLAGVVTGTTAPCVLTSRGDTVESKLYSIALAALLAQK